MSDTVASSMEAVADIDPYPFYEGARAKAPLVWDESMSGWLVTGYDLCRHVEESERRFRHPYADADATLIKIKGGRRNPTIVQGREHFNMHRFLLRLFSPKLVEDYRPQHVRPIANLLIDRFAKSGRVELCSALTTQVPPRVLMSLFAMDWRDDALAARVLNLHEVVMNWIGQQNRGTDATDKAREAARELDDMLLPYIEGRRLDPGDDLISRVWQEGPSTLEGFTGDDALAITREMFLAGTDTTVHALANALYILLNQPQIMARVNAERGETLDTFVEEALRLYGSVQYRFRLANEDCNLGGQDVKKNEVLVLINSAANRDPEHFGCPVQVDLDREQPRDHLAFNAGPRTCIGAALARAEMVDTIDLLLDRTRNLRLDPGAEAPSFRFHYTRSFRPLNVLFDVV